jgi:hypothetical protein
MAIKFVLLVGYSIAYLHYMRRAFRNHQALPFARYRMTNMYLRIQVLHRTVVSKQCYGRFTRLPPFPAAVAGAARHVCAGADSAERDRSGACTSQIVLVICRGKLWDGAGPAGDGSAGAR